jgi:hypothetical protein
MAWSMLQVPGHSPRYFSMELRQRCRSLELVWTTSAIALNLVLIRPQPSGRQAQDTITTAYPLPASSFTTTTLPQDTLAISQRCLWQGLNMVRPPRRPHQQA